MAQKATQKEPDTVIRRVQTQGSSGQYVINIPKSWADEMKIGKGTYMQLDLGVTRERIIMRKASMQPVGERAKGGDEKHGG